MSARKMPWILGLAAVIGAPQVLAQSALQNPWIYFGINTLIVWGIVFLAAKLIATELTKKENYGVHFAIFAISAVISWNFVGGGGFIWKVGFFSPFFNMEFFVNTVFMTLILYFGLTLFGMKMDSPEGKSGMWILCILVGAIVSSSMDYYFWQQGTFKQLLDLLFGQHGILTMRQGRLIIFTTATVLFVWLFQDIKIGGDSPHGSKLNWAFALILAANLASDPDPISMKTLVWLAYAVTMFLIVRGMWRGSRT